jgi:poly(A) polymerase
LGAKDGATRLVGGAVRDGLLGIDVSDIDLATILSPQDVTTRLEAHNIKVVPTGIAHGTVTAVLQGRPVEITTLRRDVSTDGRRATVAYTDDWREDAARRDFTINALYAHPVTGEIFDYFDGLKDMAARRVRFIGDARERIAEDHLRILRYFRFLARFGALPPDEQAYRACADMANNLMALSRERISDELLKLLALPDPAAVLRLMIDGGIFAPVLPEIGIAGLERMTMLIDRERTADVAPSTALRLAALLPQDAVTGDTVAARLKLSNKMRKRIVAALTPPAPHHSGRELAFRLGKEGAIDQILLRPEVPVDWVKDIREWQMPDFPLSGRDIIALGVNAGPDVARLLRNITEKWIAQNFPGREETQVLAAQAVASFCDANQ